MQEKKPKTNKKIMLILILILPIIAYLIFTTIVIFNYYTAHDKYKTDIPEIMPEAANESNKKYSDQMHPSGMMVVELPVLNRSIQDKDSLSPDCFVDLLVKDALLFQHVRVIDFSADKADPNITNVTFSLTIGQEKSLESARQDIAEIRVYIKKNEHGLRNEGLSVQNRPLVFENNGQMFSEILGTPGR